MTWLGGAQKQVDESDNSNAKSSRRITELEEDGKQRTREGSKRREDKKIYLNKTSGFKILAVEGRSKHTTPLTSSTWRTRNCCDS